MTTISKDYLEYRDKIDALDKSMAEVWEQLPPYLKKFYNTLIDNQLKSLENFRNKISKGK